MDNPIEIEKDFEELEKQLQEEIDARIKETETLKVDRKNIGDPKKLTDSISQIVWEQFILQIAGQAGQDFIKQNNNLNLSLSKADHILNSDSFVKGDMPSHNFVNAEKYQQRYDSWNSQFTDSSHDHLSNDYRKPYDANRPKGDSQFAMDHTIPVKEIIQDGKAAAFMSQEEKISFANDTDVNLKPLDSVANASKGDKAMKPWLDSKRADKAHPDGATPDERFNIDRKELEERDDKARAEWDKAKKEAEHKAVEEGKASIRAEGARSASVTV